MTRGKRHQTRKVTGVTWCEYGVDSGCEAKVVAKKGLSGRARSIDKVIQCIPCAQSHSSVNWTVQMQLEGTAIVTWVWVYLWIILLVLKVLRSPQSCHIIIFHHTITICRALAPETIIWAKKYTLECAKKPNVHLALYVSLHFSTSNGFRSKTAIDND